MLKTGAILLASGRSERFGANKLLADFGGRPMIARAMDALSALPLARVAVVTAYPEIAALARAYGFEPVENAHPERGQAHSIALGVRALCDADALLLLVGDQPLLTAASLESLLDEYTRSAKRIACLRDSTHMGNPAVFSSAYFPALMALEGDCGAKSILRAHEGDLLAVDCRGENELCDCDDPQALRALAGSMR
ncbi:MAG: nucleotidyltransferase family protein [Clostridia bacterium]|nr:nucleotidyltransferase family protein [Clostridia bacterium]